MNADSHIEQNIALGSFFQLIGKIGFIEGFREFFKFRLI